MHSFSEATFSFAGACDAGKTATHLPRSADFSVGSQKGKVAVTGFEWRMNEVLNWVWNGG